MYEITNKRTGQLEVPDRFGRVRVIPPGQTSLVDLSDQVLKVLKAEERRTNKVLLKHVSGPEDWFAGGKKPENGGSSVDQSTPPATNVPSQPGEATSVNSEDEDGQTADHTSPSTSSPPPAQETTQQPSVEEEGPAGGVGDADAKGYRKSIAAALLERQDAGSINYDELLEATFALVDKSEFKAPRPRKLDLLDALRKVAAEG